MTDSYRPTLSDVAKMAGVSVATASRALSNPDLVAEDTRQAVRDAADSCSYRINLVARSLRTQRTNTVLVLVPSIDNTFYPEIVRGLEDSAHDSGFSMILGLTGWNPARERSYYDLAVTQRADGLIALGGGLSSGFGGGRKFHVPIVQVLEAYQGDAAPYVGIDNWAAATIAVRHLVELGHRCIGHIAGRSHSVAGRQRRDAYVETLRHAGLPVDERHIVEGDYSHEVSQAAMVRLLNAGHRPTAVFCANDASALGAMRACRAAGLRVPDDISIIGVDDIDDAAWSDPPLTTVRQPRHAIGRRAMDLLLERVKSGSNSPQSIMLPAELVVRQSTARYAS